MEFKESLEDLQRYLPFAFGLANHGVYCFSNSFVQCILTSKKLIFAIEHLCKSELHEIERNLKSETYNNESLLTLFCQFAKISKIIPSHEERVKYPIKYTHLIKILNDLSTKFYKTINQVIFNVDRNRIRYEQQDAKQTLDYVLDKIRDKLGQDVTKELCMVERETVTECLKCRAHNYTNSSISEFYISYSFDSLAKDGIDNFQFAIQAESNYITTEIKEMPCRRTNCTNVKNQLQSAKQIYLIKNLPQVLIVFIPRALFQKKETRPILRPDLELNLTAYPDRYVNNGRQVECKYQLIGLICHLGNDPNSGHYISIAKRHPFDWYKLNDSEFTKIQENTIFSNEVLRDVTILLYERLSQKQSHLILE